jgi:hypothetical protein
MGDLAKCLGCGAVNLLPEGKDSMFCAYCGAGVERQYLPQAQRKDLNLIQVKPEIINGDLVLKNRKLKSISELIVWFSDAELSTVKCLDLSENEICSLKGLGVFTNANRIYLDDNRISMSEDDINELSGFQMNGNSRLSISFMNNTFTSLDWVEKIDFDKVLNTYREVTLYDQYYGGVEIVLSARSQALYITKTFHHPKSSNRNCAIRQQPTKRKQFIWL